MTCTSRFCKSIKRVSEKSKVVSRLLRMVDELNAVNCFNMDPAQMSELSSTFPGDHLKKSI